MTIPASPPAYIDWDDSDAAPGDGLSKSDVEQLMSNQRFFSQNLADTESAWRRGSDFFTHFSKPLAYYADDIDPSTSPAPTQDLGNHVVSLLGSAIVGNAYLDFHEVRRIDRAPCVFEARVRPSAWSASYSPVIALTDVWSVSAFASLPGSFNNSIVVFAGSSSGTWQVVTRHNDADVETTDDIAFATFNDWIVIRITATETAFTVSMGTDPESLTDVAEHTLDLPTNFNLSPFLAMVDGGNVLVDYVKLTTIGNPLSIAS